MKSILAIACGVVLMGGPAAWGVTLEWTQQIGSPAGDLGYGVSADRLGNVYISGTTWGSLGGPHSGDPTDPDAFLAKYDSVGNLLWAQQLGTDNIQDCRAVSADSLGNVYISGWTQNDLNPPPTPGGGFMAFVAKYDASGNQLWTRQLVPFSQDEYSRGVTADGLGNVYMSGLTFGSIGGRNAGSHDAFVSKFDAAGNLLWTRQIGTPDRDWDYGISADGLGNVYLTGATLGSLGGPNAGDYDAFVSKFNAAGNLQWTRQLGTVTTDESYDVSADGLGNVFISGGTWGSLGGPNAGRMDAFVSKYDATGNLSWTRQFGATSMDASSGVSADGLGNVYVSSKISGVSFASKYDAAGNLLWTQQLGTGYDASGGVSTDGVGNIFLSGTTATSVFVTKYSESPIPEPSTLILAMLPAIAILRYRRKRLILPLTEFSKILARNR
jgi:hypothetical protein